MTIDLWGLGLQAVNVLILVWLLTRVFWRPVADAIAARQKEVQATLNDANEVQEEADKALTKVTKDREGMAAEREDLLREATKKAETDAKAVLAEASKAADKLLAAAKAKSKRETEASRVKNADDAAQLAVDIAGKLLARLDIDALHGAFLDLLIAAIDNMSAKDRETLTKNTSGMDLVSAVKLNAAAKAKITKALHKSLEITPDLNFKTDAKLIAGFELRTAHFALRDSWHTDLDAILKDLKNAA